MAFGKPGALSPWIDVVPRDARSAFDGADGIHLDSEDCYSYMWVNGWRDVRSCPERSPVPSIRLMLAQVADVASLATTPLAPSHYLELVRPRAQSARVESVLDETRDVRTLTLRPAHGWNAHRPGQFTRVTVAIAGRLETRAYSISSSPDRPDGRITITVKAAPGGRVSPVLAHRVKPGDYVKLTPPQGEFVLPEATPERLLFITAGSGITPVMSMLRTLATRAATPDTVHVHYAPHAGDVIFGAELARLAVTVPRYRFAVLTTRDRGASSRRFDRASLEALVPDWTLRDAWACGPQGLLGTVEACFASVGRADRLHVERFSPATRAAPADASADGAGGRVRFGRSRVDVRADGRTSLLEIAERAGVSAPHGCRMGICHTCDSTMVAGCVRDLRTGRRIDEPGARIQVCVCAAAGDVELSL